MTTSSQDSIRRRSQAENSPDYPNVLFQELDIFCPSPEFQEMNGLLNTIPIDLKELGKAARGDAALAAEVIRLCNSSLFDLARPVSSLDQAVVATGADIVQALLLTCWLTKLTGSKVATRENQLFWSHSLLVARISRRISEWAGLAQPEQVFLAGLLHDVGALPFLTLLSRYQGAKRQNFLEDVGESLESQRLRFGTDHCELGRRLNAILDFPRPLAEVVARHHQRKASLTHLPLLSIVGCAEAVSQVCYLCKNQKLPAGDIETYVKNALQSWLPILNPSARLPLIAALNSYLLENICEFNPGAESTLNDSISGPEVQASTPDRTNAGQ